MSKKIIIALLVLSPLFFIIIGYPVKQLTKNVDNTISQRCYQLGNTKEFFSCFKDHKRLGGTSFIKQVITDVNDLQTNMGYLFIFFLALQIILTFLVV